MTYKIGYFVGSLASNSINRTLSKALIALAPEGPEFTEIPIKDLPLYSADYDEQYPPDGPALKEAVGASDGILFVSPEYNRSIPGELKFLRPYMAEYDAFVQRVLAVSAPGHIGDPDSQ